jgi:predicted XRE-type DNA-binding protein
MKMTEIPVIESSGNVFADLGFSQAEAEELTAKTKLIMAMKAAIARSGITQVEAAALCGTDQPTLSKIVRGRMESVTIDRLAGWLNALGQDVEITVRPGLLPQGQLRVVEVVP